MLNEIKKFTASEVELEYLLTGEDNDQSIIFVHGAGTNLRQFVGQHLHFSKEYRVLSVSLRGHGMSSEALDNSGEGYAIKKMAKDLLELLDYLRIKSVHYVGNSAGGVIGYELININPELFKSFITFGTTAEMKLPGFATNLVAGIDRVMMKINPSGYVRFVSKHSSKYKHVQDELYREFMMCSGRALSNFRRNLGSYSYVDTIKYMDIPFLLIQGTLDKDINRSLKSTLQAIHTNSRASVIKLEEVGHFANLDKPEEFNKIIESFIKKYQIEGN